MTYSFDPRIVDKPWGSELIWADTEHYAGKILLVKAGESLSLQYHEVKDESWYVLEGRAKLELGPAGEGTLDELEITAGQAFRFRPTSTTWSGSTTPTAARVRANLDVNVVRLCRWS